MHAHKQAHTHYKLFLQGAEPSRKTRVVDGQRGCSSNGRVACVRHRDWYPASVLFCRILFKERKRKKTSIGRENQTNRTKTKCLLSGLNQWLFAYFLSTKICFTRIAVERTARKIVKKIRQHSPKSSAYTKIKCLLLGLNQWPFADKANALPLS